MRFRFLAPRGFDGFHEFTVEDPEGDSVVIRHTPAMRPHGAARLGWPLVFRPLHDALLEDALDRAERVVTGQAPPLRRRGPYVQRLRAVLGRGVRGRGVQA